MVKSISDVIISQMILNNIIQEDKRELYSYELQVIAEFMIGHAVILILAGLAGHFIDILLFLIPFDALRSYTGGFHCKTNIGCICMSLMVCGFVVIIREYIHAPLEICQGAVILSMIFMYFIGALNHPNMMWSDEELDIANKRCRITILVLGVILIASSIIGADDRFVYYFGMGTVQCVFSIVLELIIRKGVNRNEKRV